MCKGLLMDMNIQKYLAFFKTVEYGSFTKAAERLNYSQSGISRQISDLEKEWNIALLERSRSGVRLTSDGLALLPYAKRVCEEYEKLQTQVDELNGLQSGIIRRLKTGFWRGVWTAAFYGCQHIRIWTRIFWSRTSCLLCCRRIMPLRTVSVFW